MKIFNNERALTPSWDLLAPSIELLRRNILQVMWLSFLPGLFITVGSTMFGDTAPKHWQNIHGHQLAGLIIIAVSVVWEILVFPGYTYLQAEAAKGNRPGGWECFTKGLRRFFPLLGTSFAAGALIILGCIAFIIPGLILVRAYYLAPYYAVEGKLPPFKALAASSRDTKPVSAWIWGTIGVAIVFSFIAAILGSIPVAGVILSALASYPYAFGSALRYNEIVHKVNPRQFVRHTPEA